MILLESPRDIEDLNIVFVLDSLILPERSTPVGVRTPRSFVEVPVEKDSFVRSLGKRV